MIAAIAFVLTPVVILVVVSWGLFWALTRRTEVRRRRVLGVTVTLGVGILVAAYLGFVGLIVDAHFDVPDLFSPTEESKLAEWTEACAMTLAPGRTTEEVLDDLRVRGAMPMEEYRSELGTRKYYRLMGDPQEGGLRVVDKAVRNHSLMGDSDLSVYLQLRNGKVSSCTAEIRKYGR